MLPHFLKLLLRRMVVWLPLWLLLRLKPLLNLQLQRLRMLVQRAGMCLHWIPGLERWKAKSIADDTRVDEHRPRRLHLALRQEQHVLLL